MGIPTDILKAWADAADCANPARRAINAELRRGGKGGNPRAVRGLVGGDKPVSVTVPVRVVSTPNERTHRQAAARLVRHQRNLVALWLGRVVLPAPPVRVTLTRIYSPRLRQRPFDDDNYHASLKACRDEVASLYGIDDAEGSGLVWAYGPQEAGDAAGVRVEITPVRSSVLLQSDGGKP